MNKLNNFKDNIKNNEIILAGILGIIIFLLIYGFESLNVANDHWIFNRYIEKDIIQHYAGWMAFRNSPWGFPLGIAENIKVPTGEMISFMDAIPIASIFFKLFRNLLPETFQFFGIYILICFFLQAVSSALLARLFTKNKVAIILSSILFTFSPIMIERAFRHTALASHWLIIYSLYFYFKSKQNNYSYEKGYLLISILSVCIHPYMTPLVILILSANMFNIIVYKKIYIKPILFVCINILSILIIGFIIGVFGSNTGKVFVAEGYGFGYFCMNLNSILNPLSISLKWSIILPNFPQTLGNYDGFNYLGLGIIIFGIYIIIDFLLCENKNKSKDLKIIIKENIGLFLVCIAMTIFAVSNVVTFNDKIIFEYYLPDFIVRICDTFRSSGRIFYPVYYIIFLSEIVFLIRKFFNKKNFLIFSLSLLIFIQLTDISPVIIQKHKDFNVDNIEEKFSEYAYNSEKWNYIGKNFKNLYLLNAFSDYDLAAFCGKNNLKSNISISIRISKDITTKQFDYSGTIKYLLEGNDIDNDTIYLTTNENIANEILSASNKNIKVYKLDNYWIITKENPIFEQ